MAIPPTRLGLAVEEEVDKVVGASALGFAIEEDMDKATSRPKWLFGLPVETPCLLNAFFVAVATTLGTGILALPVKLANCGLGPFFLCFLLVLLMQLATATLMVDLLQHVHAELANSASGESHGGADRGRCLPDLHRMGQLLLGPTAARAFDAMVLLHFLAVLVSYNLAGAEAYAELLGLPYRLLILPFWLVYCVLIVFGSRVIQPVITVATVLKCAVFVVALVAVAMVGFRVGVQPTADWSRVPEPFLISTFALGGMLNTMPVTYSLLPFNLMEAPHEKAALLRRYRVAVLCGLVFVFLVNMSWCHSVLHIVPQTPPAGSTVDVSLETAAAHGQVATIPLAEIITTNPRTEDVHWVSGCVTIFVLISISVSFTTVGTGMKHVLDGFAYSRFSVFMGETVPDDLDEPQKGADALDMPVPGGRSSSSWAACRYRTMLYLASFGFVLLLAVGDPEGFVTFIEIFGSFALNMECGCFVALMAWNARSSHRPGVAPEANFAHVGLICFTGLLFLVAVIYDVWTVGISMLGLQTMATLTCGSLALTAAGWAYSCRQGDH